LKTPETVGIISASQGRIKTMKNLVNLALLPALLWLGESNTCAQTYENVYGFTVYSGYPGANIDGAVPYGTPVFLSNVLYGTSWEGGTNGEGTVWAVHTDGTGFTNLHTFGKLSTYPTGTNNDGAQPYDGLILSGNTLYGTAYGGGTNGWGTVFRINTDGSGFTNLHNLNEYTDGANPKGGLILTNNTLFGTTSLGGTNNFGTVFRINTNGTGFTNLYSFSALAGDGAEPLGGVVLSGTNLYGTTQGGGTNDGNGILFSLGMNGKGFSNLFTFAKYTNKVTNSTGGTPYASLIVSNGTLYGTTHSGGTNGNGVVFAANTDGSNFRILHTFAIGAHDPTTTYYTNADGAVPTCQLLLVSNTLYGTTSSGGSGGIGTVFALDTGGTGFTNLYDFNFISILVSNTIYGIGGNAPGSGVTLAGNTFYGTTTFGGTADGNVYGLVMGATPVSLTAQTIAGQLTLSWSNSSYSLQSTGNLGQAFTNVVGAISPYVVAATNSRQFFRLRSN
jgi:uncharacterized repeat protein (TIGR03803 family)